MGSPTTSGIGFSYTINVRSGSPSACAEASAQAKEGRVPMPQPERSKQDKTYQEAITADPSVAGAVNAMTGLAAMIGGYYTALINQGVPEAYAERLTEEMKRPVYRKVLAGMGFTPDEIEQEMARL